MTPSNLVLAGNLETNGNAVDIFLDTIPGQGQNTLIGAQNPDIDFRALHRMGFSDGTEPDPIGTNGPGLTFPTGFAPDFYLTVKLLGDPTTVYVNYAELYVDAQNPGVGYYLGAGLTTCATEDGLLENADALCPFTVRATFDNRNVYGVSGGFGLDAPGVDVTTGLELAIPLSAIGSPTGDIHILAFLNAPGHDWMSNQLLGGIYAGYSDNLGDPRFVDLSGFWPMPAPFAAIRLDDNIGACCTGMNCGMTTELTCTGVYLGDNTTCAGNPCDTTPAGRCCYDDGLSGECSVTTETACDSAGGVYGGDDTDCTGCPCLLSAPGACCTNEVCDYIREEDCIDGGGVFLGAYRECWAEACTPAACCFGHTCAVVANHECIDGGGRYQYGVTTCDPDPCAQTIWTPYVAGDMNGWEAGTLPMTEVGEGVYELQLFGLEPYGRYEFKITDGTWDNALPDENSWCYADEFGEVVITYDANTYDDGWAPRLGSDRRQHGPRRLDGGRRLARLGQYKSVRRDDARRTRTLRSGRGWTRSRLACVEGRLHGNMGCAQLECPQCRRAGHVL